MVYATYYLFEHEEGEGSARLAWQVTFKYMVVVFLKQSEFRQRM